MNQKHLTFIFVLLFLFTLNNLYPYTEKNILQNLVNPQELKSYLSGKKDWITYPAYSDRKAWNDYLGAYKDTFIKSGEEFLSYEWKPLTATDYLEYTRSGNRSIAESKYNNNINSLVNLFVAELAEGKGRFIDAIANHIYSICEMTTWSIPAHLTLQKTTQNFPNPEEQIIELASGDVGSLMSWIYYFLQDELQKIHPLISTRLKKEIKRRILDPYLNDNHYWWLGFDYTPGKIINNWNPWCNANVLQAFLLVEDDQERLLNGVYKTIKSVDQFINYTNDDGACEEGPSYWGHAAGKLLDYLKILHDATGGKISIFQESIIRNMGEYISRSYIGDGWVVNFADATARLYPNAYLVYRYGDAIKSEELKSFASLLNEKGDKQSFPNFGRDFYRLIESLKFKDKINETKPFHKLPTYTWYPQTEFCYMYSEKEKIFVAAKGGHNNESHNHNDVGTFIYYANNKPIIIDVGVGTYTKQTFGKERYSIWTMQSQYHNLPVIDGKQQVFGLENRSSNVKFDPRGMSFSLDINKAYPQLSNNSVWNRKYQLKGKTLIVEDKFNIVNPSLANNIVFMSAGKVSIAGNGSILIEQDNERVKLQFNSDMFVPKIETVEVTDKRISNVWGNTVSKINLEAKNKTSSGKYTYKLIKL